MSMHEFTRLLELSTTAPRPTKPEAEKRIEETFATFSFELSETMLQNREAIRKAAEAVARLEGY